ncbi:MAG: FtsX-like permease family protein, partial [Bacilli bacterium]
FENKLNFNGLYSPFLKDSKSKLYGQLPVNDFEVLLSMFVSDYDEEVVLDIIGKEYTFSVKEKTGFSAPIKLTVTGVIHSDTYVGGYYVNDSTFDRMNLVPPTTLDNNQLDISFNDVMISYYPDQIFSSRDLIGNQANIYYSNISENATIILDGVELEVVPNVYNKFYNNAVIISEELFIEKYQRDNYQYTLHINDINKINEVEKHLFNNGYYTFVPSIDLKNNMDLGYIGGVIEYVSMTLIMIFMIFVLYLMGYLIIRIVLNTRIKDYTILRIIGARKSLVSNLIRFELLIFFLISYAVAFGVYFAIQSNIANILPFSFSDFLAVLFINILMSLFISRKFISKRMSSTLYSDLRVE